MEIDNLKELDHIMKDHKTDPQWIQIRGFYNRIKNSDHDLDDHIKTIHSLHKSLEKHDYKLTKDCVAKLFDLYEGIQHLEAEE